MVSSVMGYILLTIVTLFTLFNPGDSTSSNCHGTHYKTINDPRRSTGCDVSASNNTRKHLCDRHLLQDNAWYRFSSGEMPMIRPDPGSCGTYVPIWLNGSHPTSEDGIVARRACAAVPYMFPLGCGYSYNIHVRNCTGYYIYQLKTPAHCILAYCAGSQAVNCSDDHGSYSNRPPYISMPDQYYAFENSKFQLSINATDPEGYVMYRYEYLPNKTVSKVTVDKEVVTISIKQSGKVSLRTTDGEHAESSIHTISIIALPCACMNKGICKSKKSVSTVQGDFSNFTCSCIQPYSGEFCELSPCTNLPCYPGVHCTVTGHNYTCGECPKWLEGNGETCQLVLPDDAVVIEGEMKIISGLQWHDDLSVKTSRFYKNKTANIVTQIKEVYADTKEFLTVVVIRYRKGSVVVEFQVVLKEKMDDPLKPLRTRAMQNNFGIFTVEQHSLNEKNSTEVEGTLIVVSGLEWQDDLKDKSSSYFKAMSSKVASEIDKAYAKKEEYIYVFVTSFRSAENKVVVIFKLVLRKKINNPLETLRNNIKDGKLGKLGVEKDSVKETIPTESSNDSSYFGLHKVVFIVVVCLVSLLALVSIVVCGICIRKKHISIIMLTTHQDDRHEVFQNSGRQNSRELGKHAAHNQVVDIYSLEKRP